MPTQHNKWLIAKRDVAKIRVNKSALEAWIYWNSKVGNWAELRTEWTHKRLQLI